MTSKRKTKQLRWLVTGLMLAMTMVMPTSMWAQVMYTVYDNGTLTFKYGNKPWSGNVYDVPTDPTHTDISPDWLANTTSITTRIPLLWHSSMNSSSSLILEYGSSGCLEYHPQGTIY